MATSIATRTLQIFIGLSSVSTISFAPSFIGKREEFKLQPEERTITNDHREDTEIKEVFENVMQEAATRMEKSGEAGEKGCFWLFEDKWLELFMCVDMLNPAHPTLFHYARNDRSVAKDKKLNEIIEITREGAPFWKMTFNNYITKAIPRHLSISFGWLSKWNSNLLPKTHCKVVKDNESREYTLICDNPRKTGGQALTKRVHPEPPYKKKS